MEKMIHTQLDELFKANELMYTVQERDMEKFDGGDGYVHVRPGELTALLLVFRPRQPVEHK